MGRWGEVRRAYALDTPMNRQVRICFSNPISERIFEQCALDENPRVWYLRMMAHGCKSIKGISQDVKDAMIGWCARQIQMEQQILRDNS